MKIMGEIFGYYEKAILFYPNSDEAEKLKKIPIRCTAILAVRSTK